MFDLKSWLQPGDILLYHSPNALGWWIRFKTWEDVNHCEMYIGNGTTAASRGGVGVGTFQLYTEGLRYVLRPNQPFDIYKMLAFHDKCVGQKYDSWGLIKVFYMNKDGNLGKAYCSEHTARMCRVENGGPGLFNAAYDCDRVSPGMLKSTPHGDLWRITYVEDDSEISGAVPCETCD